MEIERSCFYGMGSAPYDPVLLVNERGIPSLVDRNSNFVKGTWTCGSVGEDVGDATCQEVRGGSPTCLAED